MPEEKKVIATLATSNFGGFEVTDITEEEIFFDYYQDPHKAKIRSSNKGFYFLFMNRRWYLDEFMLVDRKSND